MATSNADDRRPIAGDARAAARKVTGDNSVRVGVPIVGTVTLPPPEGLAFLGGIGLLAIFGAVDWPVALLLGAGHTLATRAHNKVLREFGEAMEQA